LGSFLGKHEWFVRGNTLGNTEWDESWVCVGKKQWILMVFRNSLQLNEQETHHINEQETLLNWFLRHTEFKWPKCGSKRKKTWRKSNHTCSWSIVLKMGMMDEFCFRRVVKASEEFLVLAVIFKWILITKKMYVYQYMSRNIDYNINNKKNDWFINI
jgi:hypothetical protein